MIRKITKITLGLIMSAMLIFAFTACGDGDAGGKTPADEAVAALDQELGALKSADISAIKALDGGEEVFGEAESAFGSEEEMQAVIKAMFGHFDYKLGTPEQIDDSNVNVPVTVTNANMTKAMESWFSDLMAYAMSNPDIANDEAALQAKTIEMLASSVEKTAEGEDGTITTDVVIPMVNTDGQWTMSEDTDDEVIDAITGGFVSAMTEMAGGMAGGTE